MMVAQLMHVPRNWNAEDKPISKYCGLEWHKDPSFALTSIEKEDKDWEIEEIQEIFQVFIIKKSSLLSKREAYKLLVINYH